jgi:MFS family permease
MEPEQPPPEAGIKIGSALGDLANISHQKGDVGLITLSKDKIEAMLSATGSLGSNFLFFMLGAALSILLALKSGGVEEGWRPIFWLGLIGSLIWAAFFGAFTVKQELQKKRFRKEIRDTPSTPLR